MKHWGWTTTERGCTLVLALVIVVLILHQLGLRAW